MPDQIGSKWRPPLALVLGGALALVLGLPLAGLLVLREMQGTFGFRHSAMVVAAAVGLVTLVLGWLLARLLLLPMRALADRAAAVRRGEAAGALDHYGTQELGELGGAVLAMARELQDREATIRHFANHVSHALKAPLTTIKAAAELLEGADLSAEDARLVAAIAASSVQMQADLAALHRVAAAREAAFQGQAQLTAVAARLRQMFAVEITATEALLPMAEDGLVLALGHLVANAAEHGATRIDMTVQDGALKVADNGQGISDGNRDRIFAPFFTTRRDAGGTGMGLAILRGLLAAHGGEILLDPGPVTCFRIRFQ